MGSGCSHGDGLTLMSVCNGKSLPAGLFCCPQRDPSSGHGQPSLLGAFPVSSLVIFEINIIRLQAREKEIKIASCTNKSCNASCVLPGLSPANCPKGHPDTNLVL